MKSRKQLILDRLNSIKEKRNFNSLDNSQIYNSKVNTLPPNAMNHFENKHNSTFHRSSIYGSATNLTNEIKKSTTMSKLTENLRKISYDHPKIGRKLTIGSISSVNEFNLNQLATERDFDQTDCVTFVLCVREVLKMFSVEEIFIGKIIDPKENVVWCKILERIYDPVLRSLITDAEILVNNIVLITSKLTSKYVIAMFTLLSDLVKLKPNFLRIFEKSILITKTARHISNSIELLLSIFILLEKKCASVLNEILGEIKTDPITLQPNGNIHPITTDTISFALNLLNFDIIAGI